MTLFRTPIPVEEAMDKIWKYKKDGQAEEINMEESIGRFLGEDLIATTDVPWFDKSPYDGFALRAEDTAEANSNNEIEIEVIDYIGAGAVSEKEVQPYQAIRIMTGAPIPKGCDAVMMLELVKEKERDNKQYIRIKRKLEKGDNISFQGEDIKKGKVLVKKGTKINPGIYGLLATFGYHKVKVMKKPIIGVFATGNELLDIDEALVPGKIRNSNSYTLCAQIERSGAEARYLGKVSDTYDATYEALKKAMNEVDIVVTTGGVSVGDFDYIPKVYEKLRVEVLCNKIAMRPGSVTTIAQLNGKLLYGLSGNPSACYVGFELYLRPIIRYLLGSEYPFLKKIRAILHADFKKANPFTRFVRSKLVLQGTKVLVEPVGLDKSGAISSLAFADCLMVLPGGTRGYEKGMEVDVLLLEEQTGSEHK